MTEKEIKKMKIRFRARRADEFIEACKSFRKAANLFCDCVRFDDEELDNDLADAVSAALRAQNGASKLFISATMEMWEMKRAEVYDEPENPEVSNG